MGDNSTATTPTRTGVTLLCTLLAASGAAGMAVATGPLRRTAEAAYADQALIGWVLVAIAAFGALLCLYLTIIWGLATAILLAGPATRTGTASLVALRLLAPRLAQRIATGAAVATTATALVLAPAMASQGDHASTTLSERAPAQTSQLLPAADPAPAPDSAAPGSAPGHETPRGTALLPPLGWGEEHAAGQPLPDDSAPTAATTSASATPTSAGGETTSSRPLTVIVRGGDSLWSITDDLLGPGTSDAAQISTTWPLLHKANHEAIGPDPDHLLPGTVLTVPHSLTSKDMP